VDNRAIADVLVEIAELLEVKGEVVFKTRAYHRAAQAIASWPESLARTAASGRLEQIPGVGKAISEKVETLLNTGTLPFHEKLKAEFPEGMLSLMAVPGVGPKTAYRISKELDVHSPEELEAAARAGQLRTLSGMGEKREEAILHSLALLRRKDSRRPIAEVLPIVRDLQDMLEDIGAAEQLTAAGSVRRFEETIGDVDFIGTSRDPQRFMDAFVALPVVQDVLGHGSTKSSVITVQGLQVDVRLVEPQNYGNLLQHFTGSRQHNINLREYAQRIGLSISEYGMTEAATGVVHTCTTEEDVYRILKLPYLPPELRQGLDEIERALRGQLPRLIEDADILGDVHAHTDWSDGRHTLDDMANAGEKRGWQYMCITDHSAGRAVAGGLQPERLQQQIALIRAYRPARPDFHLLAGIEVDIRADGSLDCPDELLEQLDFVVASIHSAMQQDEATMTARIIRAMESPHVDTIGHLTGRLVGHREPIALNIGAIMDAASRTGTALEINGSMERLDMKDSYVRMANERSITLSMGTDAHAISSLDNLTYSVLIARRGWTEAKNVLNTWPADRLLTWMRTPKAERSTMAR